MHTHVQTVKAKLGLKTDHEFAQVFSPPVTKRTVQLWKRGGMSGHALRQLCRVCEKRGMPLDAELAFGLSLGVPEEPQKPKNAA